MRFNRKYSSPPCSKCGSQNTITKRFDTGKGSREYLCKDCGKCFSERINPKPKPSIRKVAKSRAKPLCSSCGKPVCICKELEEKLKKEVEFQKSMKSALSLDSVRGVPCFTCSVEDSHCVEKCERLENFLIGGLG